MFRNCSGQNGNMGIGCAGKQAWRIAPLQAITSANATARNLWGRLMVVRLLVWIALSCSLALAGPAGAQKTPHSDELVLAGDFVITVSINGTPVRLQVRAEMTDVVVINPDVAERLKLKSDGGPGLTANRNSWVKVSRPQNVNFGAGPVPISLWWLDTPITDKADGVIGIPKIPYWQVTFALNEPEENETIDRFPLMRLNHWGRFRIGTATKVRHFQMMLAFAPSSAEGLITGASANFLATHFEGGFVQDSGEIFEPYSGNRIPIRRMRLAIPLMLGELPLDEFRVRMEGSGEPDKVGEIQDNDSRFEQGQILVSRRKGRGRPDFRSTIGRDQIAHCSRLTYDLAQQEIRLSCSERAE